MKFLPILFAILLLGACNSSPDALDPRCKLVPDPGPCKAALQKWYYDAASKSCKPFIYGGCQGVVPFDTKADCEQCLK